MAMLSDIKAKGDLRHDQESGQVGARRLKLVDGSL